MGSHPVFVQKKYKTHQEFEAADFLALHLPWNLKILTCIYYRLRILERDSKTCVLLFITPLTNKSNGMFSHIPSDRLDHLF